MSYHFLYNTTGLPPAPTATHKPRHRMPMTLLHPYAPTVPPARTRAASQWIRRPGQNGYPFETPTDLDRLLDRVATRRLPRPVITVPWDQHRPDRVWTRQRTSLMAWEASR